MNLIHMKQVKIVSYGLSTFYNMTLLHIKRVKTKSFHILLQGSNGTQPILSFDD